MKLSKLLVLMVLTAALAVGCNDKGPTESAENDKGKADEGVPTTQPASAGTGAPKMPEVPTPPLKAKPDVDVQDPSAVARAFVEAVAAKDIEALLVYIHPDQKKELRGEFSGDEGFPPIPEDWSVTVDVVEKTKGTFKGNVKFLSRFKMLYDKGQWWVMD